MSKVAKIARGDNSTTTMKTMFMDNKYSRVVERRKKYDIIRG